MSRHLLSCGATLALLMLNCVASAQDSRIITFKEAVRIALEQNTTLRAAENAAALGKVDVSEARGQFLPDLRLSTQGSKNFGRNFDQTAGAIVDESSNSVSLGVSSGVTLFDGFGNIASLRQAQLFDRAGEGDLQRVRETVVFTVASNFLALIQGQEQLRVQRENLAAAAALEQQIQTYVDAGARTIADLYQQQAVVASARLALVDAERTAELAKVDLMQTLQLDPGGNYEFESPADTTSTAAAESFQLNDLLTRASAQRIDLEAEKARLDAAQQTIRIARSNRWPTVSLSAGYNSAYNSASPFSFSDQLDQRRGGSVGIGVSVPLFDRGLTSAATRRAEIQADNANLSLISLQQEVGLQVRRVYLDFRAAQEQLVAAESQVRAAELALQAAQDRYTAGASTLVELTQSRAAQVEAASALVSARYNLLFERTLVDYYVGDLDPAALSAN
jgi:outer membrane protein